MKNTGMQASPSANATGTRSTISTAKTPNKIAATSAGPIARVQEGLEIVAHALEQEQEPADARERPGDVDRQHVDPGHLRVLLVTEFCEAPAEDDEDQRHEKHSEVDDHPRDRLARSGLRRRQHVDVEVRAVAHSDGRAEHDQPHQEEARHLLGPDVARDELDEAREDLQRDRYD